MNKEYEPQTVRDLTEMVKDGIGVWQMSEQTEVKLLNLSENATFAAKDRLTGRKIIVRVQRTGYSSLEEIRSELSWISALIKEKTIHTARPIPLINGEYVAQMVTRRGDKRLLVAFEKLSGTEPSEDINLSFWFENIGEATAHLHEQARRFKKPEWFTRKVWDYDGIIGKRAYWGKWQNGLNLSREDHAVVEAVLSRVKTILDEYGINKENFGVIHSDLRTANLIIDEDKLQIIDFDDMGYGWFLFDFAATLSFLEETQEAPNLMQGWIRGYERVTKLTDYEKSLLPTFSILRRIELMAWIASHSEVPTAQQLGMIFTTETISLCRRYIEGTYLMNEPLPIAS